MEKKIGFYPGCSLEGSAREYKESVVSMARAFAISLQEVPDWNCCGASAAHNLNRALSLSLAARVLVQAAEAGLTEILVPCAACYNRLSVTQHEIEGNQELKKEIEAILGKKLNTHIQILNIIQFIQTYISPELKDRVVKPFGKVACYYGCLLVRPADVLGFDRVEDPQTMDEVMMDLGADPIDFPFKTECCGAGLSVSRTEAVARLSGKIVKEAADRGAESIVVACPMCHSNLDMRRGAIDKYVGVNLKTPVLYLTQAIGLAIGLKADETGIQRHFVKVDTERL
jgi:heterodisulfide reductase subunit B2